MNQIAPQKSNRLQGPSYDLRARELKPELRQPMQQQGTTLAQLLPVSTSIRHGTSPLYCSVGMTLAQPKPQASQVAETGTGYSA